MKSKSFLWVKLLFVLLMISYCYEPTQAEFLAQERKKADVINDNFKNCRVIKTSIKHTEKIDENTLDWGKKVLAKLNLDDLETNLKARTIQQFVSENFVFHFSRPKDIPEFLKTRKGNCYAHSRLGAFLLRLAGIPAKFAYEVHLELKTESSAKLAHERGTGLFGHYHNDHFWILYHDGNRWTPYDSALGYTGFDGFVSRYTGTETIPDNPPFIIWEDTGKGSSDMRNITEYFWNQFPIGKHNNLSAEMWYEFISNFYDKDVSFFQNPLNEDIEKLIEKAARKFFAIDE